MSNHILKDVRQELRSEARRGAVEGGRFKGRCDEEFEEEESRDLRIILAVSTHQAFIATY